MPWSLAVCLVFFSWPTSTPLLQGSNLPVEERMDLWAAYRLASIYKTDTASLANFERAASDCCAGQPENNVAAGFFATAKLMQVESMTNLFEKLESFLQWKSELERSIALHPTDADLRLFRLSVQLHVPMLLAYSSDIEKDATFIWTALETGFWASDPLHETFIREIYTAFELPQSTLINEK